MVDKFQQQENAFYAAHTVEGIEFSPIGRRRFSLLVHSTKEKVTIPIIRYISLVEKWGIGHANNTNNYNEKIAFYQSAISRITELSTTFDLTVEKEILDRIIEHFFFWIDREEREKDIFNSD